MLHWLEKGNSMHPYEKSILQKIAGFDYKSRPPKDQASKDYTLNLVLEGPIQNSIFACRMLNTLRRYKLLEGVAPPIKISDLENMKESLELGANAKLIRSTDKEGTVVMSITFHNNTPAQVHHKLNKVLERLDMRNTKAHEHRNIEQAAASTFRAAGIPVKGVDSTHEDMTIHLASRDVPEDRITNILGAMLNAGLFTQDDVKTSPTYITHKDGSQSWHLPYPDKSLREVQAGFFKAEIDIRRRAEDLSLTPWKEKVTKSTFVSGEGLGKQ